MVPKCPKYCPKCKGETHVLDVRNHLAFLRRRRECRECGYRFTTYEGEKMNNPYPTLSKSMGLKWDDGLYTSILYCGEPESPNFFFVWWEWLQKQDWICDFQCWLWENDLGCYGEYFPYWHRDIIDPVAGPKKCEEFLSKGGV